MRGADAGPTVETIEPGRSPGEKETTMALIVFLLCLIAIGLLALRFGYDSRPGFSASWSFASDWMPRADAAHDEELARELNAARQRRPSSSHVEEILVEGATEELARAA